MNSGTKKLTLIAILLGMAAGAIFAIVPAAFAKDAVVNRPRDIFYGMYTYSEDSVSFDYPSGAVNGHLPYNFHPAANRRAQWQTLWYQFLFLDWLQKMESVSAKLPRVQLFLLHG